MKRLDLKVGFQCNNRCIFCVQGDKRFTCKNKTDKEIRSILNKMSKDHDEVVFTGGEPTVRKELLDWVNYAREIGYTNIQIQTNGRMFSYIGFCQALIKAGVTEFSPALHGSSAKVHDSLTQAPGSFAQTTQGIRNLIKLGQHVITNSVITKGNYKDIPKLAQLLVDLKVDQFQFAFIHINEIIANDSNLTKTIVPRYKEAIPYVKKGLDIAAKAGISAMVEATPYCFMKGYEKFVSEQYIPAASVFDDVAVTMDYGAYRKNEGKSKGPLCSSCKMNKICEGPWKEYPQIFGWSEFIPISK